MGFVVLKRERGAGVVIWPDQSIELAFKGTKILASLLGHEGILTIDPLAGGYIQAVSTLNQALAHVHNHEPIPAA